MPVVRKNSPLVDGQQFPEPRGCCALRCTTLQTRGRIQNNNLFQKRCHTTHTGLLRAAASINHSLPATAASHTPMNACCDGCAFGVVKSMCLGGGKRGNRKPKNKRDSLKNKGTRRPGWGGGWEMSESCRRLIGLRS